MGWTRSRRWWRRGCRWCRGTGSGWWRCPGRLADPVWADDPDFDVAYHVRQSALPRPGTEAQLLDLVSRLTSRPLDHRRPLWELYLVEGLADGRVAVITKTHPALVDGLGAVDIAQVLLDPSRTPRCPAPEPWRPRRLPTGAELLRTALGEYVQRPSAAVESLGSAVTDVRATLARLSGAASGFVQGRAVGRLPGTAEPAQRRPRPAAAGGVRARGPRGPPAVRRAHGGTINDVLLTVVTGALRDWLLSRGAAVVASTSVRALVPRLGAGRRAGGSPGNRVASYLVDLPVGEPNPRVRLARLSYAMRGVAGSGRSVGADTLIALTGFAPPTLHALGARAARGLSRRMFNLVITNVPGPQVPLYAAGARMLEVFPVVPLVRGQGLSIGMTSYDGRVYVCLNADRDTVGDVDLLADLIEQELGELVEASR